MKTKFMIIGLATFAFMALILTGCGKDGAGAGAASFDGAPAEIKSVWDKARAADAANDYVAATVAYKTLLRQRETLSGEQFQAVEAASGRMNQRLVDAAMKGDAAARKALDTLGAMDRGQRIAR